jgi:hypothetical protein
MTSVRSLVRKIFHKENYVTVISGLPRSGTSMMMSALQAGGLPLLVDGQRRADASNPKGYFEYEPVKKLPKGQTGWLLSAHGKAVKIISALLITLPDDFRYRVIFMDRNIDEVLASQKRMLQRAGKQETKPVSDEDLRQEYIQHLQSVKGWLDKQDWIEVLYISYNHVLQNPAKVFESVDAFLEPELNVDAMVQVVDAELYREQQPATR